MSAMGKGMEGTCERAEGSDPGGCEHSCSHSSFPGCMPCLLPRPLSPGSPWNQFEGCPASPLWEGTAVPGGHLSCFCFLLCPSVTKTSPRDSLFLKGSRLRRAPVLRRFAVPLQVTVTLLSWGTCLHVRAAARDEPILSPSFITG